jgi:hypothetical protein
MRQGSKLHAGRGQWLRTVEMTARRHNLDVVECPVALGPAHGDR